MRFISYTVVEISLTIKVERKKWTNIGKNKQEKADSQSHHTAWRYLSVYQIYFILNGSGDIFNEKVLRNYLS